MLAATPNPNGHSLIDALASAVHSSLENLIHVEAGLLNLAHSLFDERTQQSFQSLAELWPEMATPIERLPFNRLCGGERLFCGTGAFACQPVLRRRI